MVGVELLVVADVGYFGLFEGFSAAIDFAAEYLTEAPGGAGAGAQVWSNCVVSVGWSRD